MPPLYGTRPVVKAKPPVCVPLTPEVIKYYWEFYAAARELSILQADVAKAMEYNEAMDWLLDQRAGLEN